jgi:hypothetical protein
MVAVGVTIFNDVKLSALGAAIIQAEACYIVLISIHGLLFRVSQATQGSIS